MVGLTEYDFGSLTLEQVEKFSDYSDVGNVCEDDMVSLVVLPVADAEIEKTHEQENVTDVTYSIYQLKRDEDMRDYSFASMDELNRGGLLSIRITTKSI